MKYIIIQDRKWPFYYSQSAFFYNFYTLIKKLANTFKRKPWSSGYDAYSSGRGFDSRHRILDGHDIFNIGMFKKAKMKQKEASVGRFLFKKTSQVVKLGEVVEHQWRSIPCF